MSEQGAARIEVNGLTKTFGAIRAVDNLTFTVEPGSVTGFLGPNGAGKTTTLRMVLGLAQADSGTATIGGVAYSHIADPVHAVGAVLEATSFHPGRSARNHLRVYCAAAGIHDRRADEVLATVGLTDAAKLPLSNFSLGMRQRLGLATALLGDPRVLILDEPANGLDPAGIVWLRDTMRHMAHAEGRTILVSSHVLSEVEQTVDRVVIIARGRMVHEGTLESLRGDQTGDVVVAAPNSAALTAAVATLGAKAEAHPDGDGRYVVRGATAAAVGHAAHVAGVELHELHERASSLEAVFLELTSDAGPSKTEGGVGASQGPAS